MGRKCTHTEFAKVVIMECCPCSDKLFELIEDIGGEVVMHALGVLLANDAEQKLLELAHCMADIAQIAESIEGQIEAEDATKH